MWPNVDVEEMLPPKYKKEPCRPKKLRFIEHGKTGSRMRMSDVAYRCTKCDQYGHNSRKYKRNEQNPNALKRKRKILRTKGKSVTRNDDVGMGKTTAGNDDISMAIVVARNDNEGVKQGWNDPELDAVIEEMMASYDT
ncbi:unnamed protein product [Lathyrus sativus]|nr:unnamed protein product [Lathyrus sativus]